MSPITHSNTRTVAKMFDHHLVDLDELVLSVRDRNSREYINEAIVGYRAHVYRSSLIAAWVAVVYEVISKIRELAVHGDRAAKEIVEDLEAAIALQQTDYNVAVQKLQDIENHLLDHALKKFEFISPQEQVDLERLRQDRHLCAHPAFTSESLLFQPTPELVRTHIVHAITHLLQHPPVQGKNALARIKNDILQPSFPATQKDVSDFLNARYLNQAKKTLIHNLVTVCLKTIIKQTESDLIGKEQEVLHTLVAVQRRHGDMYEDRMIAELPHLTDSSDDAELKRVFLLFDADRRCWDWLGKSVRMKLVEMAKNFDCSAADIDQILSGLEIEALRPHLVAKIGALKTEEKLDVLSRVHRPEFVDDAIALFAESENYRGAERIEQSILLPLCSMFRAEHVRRILEAAEQNRQIHEAIGSPAFFRDLFQRTADLHNETKSTWQQFLQTMSQGKAPDDQYSYPELREVMERAGMWPV